MDKRKKLALNLLMAAMSMSAVSGIVACNETSPVDYGEKGSYYFVDANGEEYVITLSDSSFVLVMDDKTELGTYTYDGSSFSMSYGESASLADDVLTIVHSGNTYHFLKKVNYTVSFDVDGGSAITDKMVMNGKTLAKPADPIKEGYEFVGWYTDEECTTSFVFDATPIKENITLYAKYAKESFKEYDVTLVVDGETIDKKETIGAVAQDLPTPKKEGATFMGWWKSDYEDAARLTAQYKGGELKENTTLYAVWKSDAPAISVSETGAAWSSVGDTASYTVKIKTASGEVVSGPATSNATTFEYDFSRLAAGDYVVEVSYGGKTAYAYYQNKALDRVSNMYVSGSDTLIYGAVENAEKYIITVSCGNENHVHTQIDNGNSTYFNFANCEMKEGGITFSVQAVAKGYATSVSDTFTFERKLDEVTGMQLDSATGEVTWNAVTNATSYIVAVTKGDETKEYRANGTKFSMKDYAGDVTIKVTAMASGYVSNSATMDATLAKFAAPKNVRVEMVDRTPYLAWDAVEGDVKEYIVYIGSSVWTTKENRMEWPATATSDGTGYTVKVQAIGEDDSESFVSNEMTMLYKAMGEVNYKAGKVSWTPVVGARSYTVKINNAVVSPADYTGTSLNVQLTREGINNITVTYYNEWNIASGSAQTEAYAYKIDLMVQGGTNGGEVYRAIGDPLALEETTKTGYEFKGWYNVPGGANVNGAKYEEEYFFGGSNMTLYASWQSKKYDVTLKLDKDSDEVFKVEDLYFEQTFKLSVPESPDPAKVFAGWVNAQTGLQLTDENGDSLDGYKWPTDGNATFYANWVSILSFSLNSDGNSFTVRAGSGVKFAKEITIPATYKYGEQDLPVTAIAGGTFEDCTSLITVNIPDSVTNIAIGTGGPIAPGSAFRYCDNLQNLNIYCAQEAAGQPCTHEKVYSSVDGVLLQHSAGGTEIYYFPQGRTGEYVIPEGVTAIPTSAFKKAKLTKVVAPKSLTVVESDAFNGSTIQEIVFQSGGAGLVLSKNSLTNCGALETITLPETFNTWDTKIIGTSSNIRNIYIDGTNGYYMSRDGVLCDTLGDTILYFPIGRDGSYTVPSQVSKIGASAFKGNTRLSEIIIHEYISEIGEDAFKDCTQLRTAQFKESPAETDLELVISKNAFYGCIALQNLKLPAQLKTLGENAFGKTYALKSVELNARADAEFVEGAFQAMSTDGAACYVQNLVIGVNFNAEASVASLFNGGKIYNVEANKDNAQYSSKDNVLFSKDGTTIVFYPYGQENNYVIPAGVTTINDYVFQGRTNLTTLNIPASVTKIGNYAFENTTITSLTFDDRTEDLEIGEMAFANCSKLSGTVTLKEKTTVLGSKAFANASKMDAIGIPASLTKMGKYESDLLVEVDCFAGCSELATINVTSGNTAFTSDSGVLFDAAKETLYLAPLGFTGDSNKAYAIPAAVKKITANAFYQNNGVKAISFADANAEVAIGEKAFSGMTALETFAVPNKMTNIADEMFKGCTALKTFNVPAAVTYIGTRAFDGCTSLTTVTFDNRNGAELEFAKYAASNTAAGNFKDGGYQFYNCSSLTELILPEGTDIIPSYMCAGASKLSKVVVPSTVTIIYTNSFGNNSGIAETVAGKDVETFELIFSANDPTKGLTSKLTEIGGGAFDQTNLTGELKLPNSLTKIGSMAFRNTTVEKVYIPSSLKTCDSQSFANSSELTEVVLENGLTTIYSTMFMNCPKLKSIEIPASVTEIMVSAFYKAGLETLNIPDTVKKVGKSAFSNLASMTEVTIGANVTWTGDQTFRDCKSLVKATIYTETFAKGMFMGCSALKTLVLPNATEITDSITKNPYNNISNPNESIETVIMSDAVTRIGWGAFCGAKSLKTIGYVAKTTQLAENYEETITYGFPQSLKSIEEKAFQQTALESVVLGDHITSLGTDAFITNESLISATINVNMEALPSSLFKGCKSLGKQDAANGINGVLILGEHIKAIGANAFANCTSLTTVTIPANVEDIGASAFSGCTALTTVNFENTEAKPAQIAYIGNGAFEKTGLTSFILPHTDVEELKLGINLFSNCAALTEVKLSPNVVDVVNVFSGIKSAPSITLYEGDGITNALNIKNSMILSSDGKTLRHVFANTGNVYDEQGNQVEGKEATFRIPDGVESIGAQAFTGCASWMKEVIIPASVATIYDYAFNNCSALEKVTFLTNEGETTYGIVSIGNYAFQATGIKELYLPASVQMVGTNVFYNNKSLTKAVIDGDVLGDMMFSGCSKLATVELNGTPAEIPVECFKSCSKLSAINLPNSISSIGESAFYACTSLTSVTLPTGLETMGAQAYYDCKGITTLIMQGALTTIPEQAFMNCSKLESIRVNNDETVKFALPATITTIGSQAFQSCIKLSELNLPMSVQSIGEKAFYTCTGLKAINLGGANSGLNAIGDYAFYNCYNTALTALEIPESVKTVGKFAFQGLKYLKDVSILGALTTLDEGAFANCIAIEEIDLSNVAFTEIAPNVFGKCTKLKSVIWPSGMTKIGAYAFIATAITELDFASVGTLTEIANLAFKDCTQLTVVSLPSTVTSLGNKKSKNLATNNKSKNYINFPFIGCTALTAINIDASNSSFYSKHGIVYTATNRLVWVPTQCEAENGLWQMDAGVEIVPIEWTTDALTNSTFTDYKQEPYKPSKKVTYSVLGGNTKIKAVQLTAGLEAIPTNFFTDSSVETVEIPNSVTTISERAFDGVDTLSTVYLPKNLTTIEDNAFNGCVGLKSITLPDGLETIGAKAFMGTKLKTITIPASVITIGKYVEGSDDNSGGGNSGGTIEEGTIGGRVTFPGGGTIGPLEPFPGGGLDQEEDPFAIKETMSQAFANCTELEEVIFKGAPKMYGGTFKDCTSLKKVTLAAGTTELEEEMFSGCTALMEIIIPASVTKIGTDAFSGWTSTQKVILQITEQEATGLGFTGKFGSATVVYAD